MQNRRELDPDASFVAIVTIAILTAGALIFSPGLMQGNWQSLLTLGMKQQSTEQTANNSPSSKFDKAMQFTGPKEGGCQNWVRDNGNWHKGRRGFTCFGIVPYTAEVAARDRVIKLPDGVDVWSLNRWYDADTTGFKAAATRIYKHYYFDTIDGDKLPEPVAVIAFDVSVNGGASLARRFLRQTDHITDGKQRASEINRLMEAHYRGIVASNPSQSVFIEGWLNRAAKQRELIAKY